MLFRSLLAVVSKFVVLVEKLPEAVTKFEAVTSVFDTLVENEALAFTNEDPVDSKFVSLVESLPLVAEKLAETKANEAEAVVKVLAVLSKLVVLVDKEPLAVL